MSDVVEQYTIRPIPGSALHGRARALLPFWFSVNAYLAGGCPVKGGHWRPRMVR